MERKYKEKKINIYKISVFISAFLIFMLSFCVSYATEKNRYTISFINGEIKEDYAFTVNTDNSGKISISNVINKMQDISSTGGQSGKFINGNSAYNVLKQKYVSYCEYDMNKYKSELMHHSTSAKVEENQGTVKLGSMMAEFLRLVIKNNGDKIVYSTNNDPNKDKIVLQNNNGNFEFGQDANKNSYDEYFYDAKSRASILNPYTSPNVENLMIVTGAGGRFKLSSYCTDEFLAKQLKDEELPYFITMGDEGAGYVFNEYSVKVDQQNKTIKILKENNEVAAFLIGRIKDGKSEEVSYKNSTTSKIRLVKSNNTYELRTKSSYDKGNYSASDDLDLYFKTNSSTIDACATSAPLNIADNSFVACSEGELVLILANITDSKIGTIRNQVELKEMFTITKQDVFGSEKVEDSVSEIDGWCYESDESTLIIYKKENKEKDNLKYYLDLDKMFQFYNQDDNYYNIAIPTKFGDSESYIYDKLANIPGSYITVLKYPGAEIKKDLESFNAEKDQLYIQMYEHFDDIEAQVFKLNTIINDTKLGGSKEDAIDLNKLASSSSDESIPKPFKIAKYLKNKSSISDEYGKIEDIIDANGGDVEAALKDVIFKVDENVATEFQYEMLKYSKIIVMFLFFITIFVYGLTLIFNNTDATVRAQIVDKYKHVFMGIFLIALTGMLIGIISVIFDNFMSVVKSPEIVNSITIDKFEPQRSSNFVINIIRDLINCFTIIFNTFLNHMARAVTQDGVGVDLAHLIFNSRNPAGNVSTMAPFSEDGREWYRYMYGYYYLTNLALCILLIAIVKLVFDYITCGGNAKKMVEVKQGFLRIICAVVGIVTGPYIIRVIITVFNYLVAFIPVEYETAKFELKFNGNTLIDAVCNYMFIWINFKIYFMFLVREIMLTFMLLATPIVFPLWAISSKFRSIHIWFGEIVTNAALQFCYALAFYLFFLMKHRGQEQFLTLILAYVALRLAEFVRDSLQGLTESWGGISEEGIADQAIGKVKGWGNSFKRKVKKTGNAMMKTSDYIDSGNTSKFGTRLHNTGAVMSGNLTKIRTNPERIKNMEKSELKANERIRNDVKHKKKEIDNMMKLNENDQNLKNYYDNKINGKEVEFTPGNDMRYKEIDEYSKYKTEYKESEDRINYLKDYRKEAMDKSPLARMKEGSKKSYMNELNSAADRMNIPSGSSNSYAGGSSNYSYQSNSYDDDENEPNAGASYSGSNSANNPYQSNSSGSTNTYNRPVTFEEKSRAKVKMADSYDQMAKSIADINNEVDSQDVSTMSDDMKKDITKNIDKTLNELFENVQTDYDVDEYHVDTYEEAFKELYKTRMKVTGKRSHKLEKIHSKVNKEYKKINKSRAKVTSKNTITNGVGSDYVEVSSEEHKRNFRDSINKYTNLK